MTDDDFRNALRLFESYAERETSLPQKTRLKILCRGYAAAARGWRLIAIGEGDEAEILQILKEATIPLMGNEKRRSGPDNKPLSGTDDQVLRNYFERDPLDLPLRHFVEVAFDEGLYRDTRLEALMFTLTACSASWTALEFSVFPTFWVGIVRGLFD